MALLVKNRVQVSPASASRQGYATLDQFIHVATPARTLPATTTDQIFRVKGGRVLVRLLLGEVTTAADATVTTLKVSSKKLDNASVAVGTAVDACSATAVTSQEVGSLLVVEGDGTGLIVNNAGAGLPGTGTGVWIAPQGEIYLTTSATNTGATKWDIWYMPLDEGAYVESVGTATAAI